LKAAIVEAEIAVKPITIMVEDGSSAIGGVGLRVTVGYCVGVDVGCCVGIAVLDID